MSRRSTISSFFFFNDTATTEIYTLSLHDALPILEARDLRDHHGVGLAREQFHLVAGADLAFPDNHHVEARPAACQELLYRSEEHTSELQSQSNLVCRLLLEKKKNTQQHDAIQHPH